MAVGLLLGAKVGGSVCPMKEGAKVGLAVGLVEGLLTFT
jgi:hypothetical protein